MCPPGVVKPVLLYWEDELPRRLDCANWAVLKGAAAEFAGLGMGAGE